MKKMKLFSFYRGSIVLMFLFILLGRAATPAHAQGATTTLDGEASCVALGGTWQATSSVGDFACAVSELVVINTLIIDSGIVLIVESDGTLFNFGGTITVNGLIDNFGTITNSDGLTTVGAININAGSISNEDGGIIDNYGTINLGHIYNTGTITNYDTININCGGGIENVWGGSFAGTAPIMIACPDTQSPTWSVPSSVVTAEAVNINGAPVNYTATASDNVGVTSSSCTPTSGGFFPIGTTTVNCTASDAAGNVGTASFIVTVNLVNNPPVANDDSYSTNEDTVLVEATVGTLGDGVLANDTDVDTEPLSAVRDTWTTNGALVFNSDGSFTYTPNASFCGVDSFTYHANDLAADSNIATVDINVVCVNNPPVADNDSKSTNEDTPVNVDVQANDNAGPSNEDQTLITFTTSNPANGTATINLDGTVTYAPSLNFHGTDTFDYVVCDNGGLCDTATVTITVISVNDMPVANAGTSYSGIEGSAIMMSSASASDPDAGDTLTYAWSVNSASCNFNDTSALKPNLTCTDNGSYTATLKVSDGTESVSSAASITVNNVAPTASLGNNGPIDEGSSATVSFSDTFDPSSNDTTAGFHYAFDCTGGSLTAATYATSGTSDSISCSFADNGNQTVSARIMDKDGGSNEYTTTVVVNNVAPTLGAISVDIAMVPVNTAIKASAAFTDPGTLDTHTATWNWGDTNISTDYVTQGSGSVTGSHEYSVPGVYTIKLTVTDKDNAISNESVYEFVVVYDPSGGFVTGGGWIDSPVNADYQYMQVGGKATFGFVAKYKKGANLPDGNTEFQFKAGDLNFKSSSYEWLVVAGNRAQFKGVGTINGEGSYKFMITADDGSPDNFRIKIWYEENGAEVVVYDNGSQQSLGGGSIVVHK